MPDFTLILTYIPKIPEGGVELNVIEEHTKVDTEPVLCQGIYICILQSEGLLHE